jgi:hypothetical protein
MNLLGLRVQFVPEPLYRAIAETDQLGDAVDTNALAQCSLGFVYRAKSIVSNPLREAD